MRLWVSRALFLVPSLVERWEQQAEVREAQHALWIAASEPVAWSLTCFWEWVHQKCVPPKAIVCAGSAEQCPLQLPRPDGSTEENVPQCPSDTKTLHVPLWPWAGCSRQNLHVQKQRFSGNRDSPDSWNKYLCKTETPNTATARPYHRNKSTGSSRSCHREPLISWRPGHAILRILWCNDRNHRLY